MTIFFFIKFPFIHRTSFNGKWERIPNRLNVFPKSIAYVVSYIHEERSEWFCLFPCREPHLSITALTRYRNTITSCTTCKCHKYWYIYRILEWYLKFPGAWNEVRVVRAEMNIKKMKCKKINSNGRISTNSYIRC